MDRRFVKHHLAPDFGAILGSDSFEPKSPRAGNVYLSDWSSSATGQFLSPGPLRTRLDARRLPHLPAAGHLEYQTFDPEHYGATTIPTGVFESLQIPGDAFWAAENSWHSATMPYALIVRKPAQYSDRREPEWR